MKVITYLNKKMVADIFGEGDYIVENENVYTMLNGEKRRMCKVHIENDVSLIIEMSARCTVPVKSVNISIGLERPDTNTTIKL